MEIEIAVAVLLLLVLIFVATVDMAFVQLSDLSLRRLTSDTVEDARVNTPFLRQILDDRPRFRFALSTTIQIILIVFSVLTTLIVLRFFEPASQRAQLFFVALLVCLVITGVFRQLVPRLITWRDPEATFLLLLPFVRPFYGVMSFISASFPRREKTVSELTIAPPTAAEANNNNEDDEDDNDSIQALIEAGEAEGILEEDERELIETVVSFGDTITNEVMTPRTEIQALALNSTVREARDIIIESKYSRLPVYREQIDNIEGMIYVRDLLQFWADARENVRLLDAPNLIRPVYFVPETKPISELLEEMQKARVQLAIVIDEYGGVAGLATVEDILEELVGEIEDEDTEQAEIVEIIEGANGCYDVPGSIEIGKIERIFGFEVETDDFTTIAGLVINDCGYVPKPGEKLYLRGLDVEVLQADDRKINLLRLRRAVAQNGDSGETIGATQ